MSNILITKESFSRLKKSFKAAISQKLSLDLKLSEVSQLIAIGLGFSNEHDLQKHFDKETHIPQSESDKKAISSVAESVTPIGVYLSDAAYFKARELEDQSISSGHEIFKNERLYFYPSTQASPVNLNGFSERTLYVKTSDLVTVFGQIASSNTESNKNPVLDLYWNKPNQMSVLSLVEKEIALHFAKNPETAIQKLCFDYADYGLDLFVMALNKQKTDIEGFGFYYFDDIHKYKEKEMNRLGLTDQDKMLIERLLDISGLTKSNVEKEKIATEIKYEAASLLGIENMNAAMQDEKNFFEYLLYKNNDLAGVISIYPHGLFRPKMKQINVRPYKVLGEAAPKFGYKQFVEYIESEHVQDAVSMKIPVYTSLYETNALQYIPVAWVEAWLRKSKETPKSVTNFL